MDTDAGNMCGLTKLQFDHFILLWGKQLGDGYHLITMGKWEFNFLYMFHLY